MDTVILAALDVAPEASLVPGVRRLAFVAALLVVLVLPAGYFSVQYSNGVEHAVTTARTKAAALTSLVAANPELWVYQPQRIQELLARYPENLTQGQATVRDTAGNPIVIVGEDPEQPVVVSSSAVFDSGRIVGHVEIAQSYREVLVGTLVAALLGLLLGAMSYATLLVLPLRALRRVTAALVSEKEALRENEENYRLLFEANPTPMWVFDEQTLAFVAVNDAAVKKYGWSREEFLAMTLADIRRAEDVPALLAHVNAGKEEDLRIVDASMHRKKDGTLFEVEIHSHVANFGGRRTRVVAAYDISERKRTERRLAEHRLLLQAIINNTSDAIYVKDRRGRYLLFNRAAEQFAGIRASEVIGQDDRILLSPDAAAMLMERDRKVIASGKVATSEEVLTDANGRDMTFLSTKGPISDARGRLIGLFGVAHDITQRKLMEEKLRESVAFRELLLQAMPLPIFYKDATGRYTGCNRAFTEFIGKSESDIVGKTVYELSPQQFAETYRDKDLELLNNPAGMQEYESSVMHADGTAHDVIFHKARIVDGAGTPIGIIGAITDITEKKREQEVLRESEERFRNLLQNVPAIAVRGCRMDGIVQYWNQASERLYGYSEAETIGRNVADLIIPPELQEDVKQAIKTMADSGRPLPASEMSLLRKNGSRVAVHSSHAIVNIPGRTPELFCLDVDLTERKQAEDTMRAAEEQFRGLVEQSIAGIYIIQDGVFAYVNPYFAEMRGYGSAADIIGLDPISLIAEKDRSAVSDNIRRLLANEIRNIAYMFTALRKDGSTFEAGVNSARASYRGRPAIIGIMQDISEKKRAEDQVKHYVALLEGAFMQAVGVATSLCEMRDPYTAGHERRVAEIAVAIGNVLGFDARRTEGLRVAGYLHDVGKIMIPAEILAKPTRLTPIEYQLIQGHPQAGYEVLKKVEFPWPVADITLQHHERMDGSGYPRGLKGEAILLEARILAVADTIEAMSSHRPYRAGLGIAKALAEIERGRGSSYDPQVVDACVKLFRELHYTIPD